VSLAMDPVNPRVILAAAWRAERKPWSLISGSEDGGVFRTADGGDTWTKLEGGLPGGLVGKIDVTVSPANHHRVWALLEASGERGGLYRSDDGGESWKRVNGDAKLRQRPWYYTHVFADPKDENTVYGLNVDFWKSVDGGVTFEQEIEPRHGDNHALWIDPDAPDTMISGNDGGASVSFDGGASWSSQMNQPTAEIYRVFVDEGWPYRIYGSQQDNSTISVPSRGGTSWNSTPPEWFAVGGCESGHIAFDPEHPELFYAGCYGGQIDRVDRRSRETREILAYPQLQLGQAPKDLKYRFQWNAPIRLSPHDPGTLYHAAQVVLRSRDGGQSWEEISPDLTTNDPETQDYAGGPISHDSTGVEVFNTIFAFEESPQTPGLLWAGSDDGRVHLSRDAGEHWEDVTPEGMPERGTVNAIALSAHDPGRAFLAVHRYREDDSAPYLFRTDDYGESWERLTNGGNGIPASHFVRAVREDPEHRGLLYAGTEFGLYVSMDDGGSWRSMQGNLPVTPVTDLQVHRRDLVVATQGRGFWVLDDLSPLHQVTASPLEASQLFESRPAHRGRGLGGAAIRYYFEELPEAEEVTLEILDGEGTTVLEARGKPGEPASKEGGGGEEEFFGRGRPPSLTVKAGLSRFDWDLRARPVETPEGVVHWGAATGRPAVPGDYQVRLTAGEWSQTRALVVKGSPASSTTLEEYRAQDELARAVEEQLRQAFGAIVRIRAIESQIEGLLGRLESAGVEAADIGEAAESLLDKVGGIEERLTQPRSRSRQDPINFPPGIDNQLAALQRFVAGSESGPTDGARRRLEDLEPQLSALLAELQGVIDSDLAAFDDRVAARDLPAVLLPD